MPKHRDMPKHRRGDSAEFALSQPQIQALQAVCVEPLDKMIIGCQLFLGIRVGELAHIRDDWITQDGDLKIPSRMACNCAECARERGGGWKPKTKAGARTLHIPKLLRKDMAAVLKARPYGMGISRIAIWYRTKTLLKRAKVRFKGPARDTGFPHCLRATCATMLATGGMDVANLSYFMGWKSIAIGDHYIRLATAKDGATRQAAEIFG